MCLEQIYHTFKTKQSAAKTLTTFRKRYRVALRGAVVLAHSQFATEPGYRVYAPLGGTGFSNGEMASAFKSIENLRGN